MNGLNFQAERRDDTRIVGKDSGVLARYRCRLGWCGVHHRHPHVPGDVAGEPLLSAVRLPYSGSAGADGATTAAGSRPDARGCRGR